MTVNPFKLTFQIQTEDYITSITPTLDGTHLLAPCCSGSVKILDPLTLNCTGTLTTTSPISEVVFGGSGSSGQGSNSIVYVGGLDGNVGVFDLRNGSSPPIGQLTGGSAILSLSRNASGTILAAGTELVEKGGPEGEDVARLLMWDVRMGAAPLAQFMDCHSDDITQVRFHPTVDTVLISGSTDNLINIYNLTPTLNEDDSLYQVLNYNSINKIGFFGPQHEYLFAQSHVETFAIYKCETADLVKDFGDVRNLAPGVEYLVDSVYDAAEGRLYLVAGTQKGDLGVLNVALDSMEVVHTLNGGHRDIVRGVYWNRGAGVFVSGGEDGVVSLWRN
ncbi:UNVERIFIED_CONTAM: WD repeat-containing protein 89 [Siphonaria sp. JEL0065]|nr:WD repeat-containing protein 89 [Siphonaria sp. JEL0065]